MGDQPTTPPSPATPPPPATPQAPPRSTALSSDDFVAFNDQLAQITAAGLPLEEGLRLVGQDLRRGPLAKIVRAISADLDRGIPLDQSLASHKEAFPQTYSLIVQAGIRSNRLPQMLLGLGQHLTLTQKLRAALWRASAYPATVFAMMLAVLFFIDISIVPTLREIAAGSNLQTLSGGWIYSPHPDQFLPLPSRIVFSIADCIPVIAITLALLLLILLLLCQSVRVRQALADHVALRLPLVGPALRDSKLAVWCDALRLGADAGLDLPSAVELAAAGATPGLANETAQMAENLRQAQPMPPRGRWIVASVRQSIAAATGQGTLVTAAGALADFYRRRAVSRAQSIPAVLMPILLAFVGICIGMILLALLLPLRGLLTWLR